MSVHINAGGGRGYEDFIYNGGVSEATKANQNIMNAELINACKWYRKNLWIEEKQHSKIYWQEIKH
ncbi:hypothetical protein [Gracilibacillus thailandensis]|uniref:hypothetical protein n=1 Tax=Gracilibacillus thailandensis TaxID=563735 RepID=UPI0023E40C60|nr:hypothetical protein [Gracilibacillus thailandensis]